MKNLKSTASVFILASAFLFVTSCKKKQDDPTPVIIATPSSSDSYVPTEKNMRWQYQCSNYTYKSTATGNTRNENGHDYQELQNIISTDPSNPSLSYIFRDGNKYYAYSEVPSATGGTPIVLDFKTIDLDLPLGTPWSTEIQTNDFTLAKYEYTVLAKGLARVVNGITYANVIAVKLHTTASLINVPSGLEPFFQSYTNAYKFDQVTYYARGIGMIEQTSNTPSLQVALIGFAK